MFLRSCVCLAALLNQQNVYTSEHCCEKRPEASRLTLRHIDPKGIGYTQGYTTLEVFLAPRDPWNEVWTPFLDLRGHIFNNGINKAANGGFGIRYLSPGMKRFWGANVYYDYHHTKYHSYNQIAVGFESIGEVWDARLNGYLPVGNKKSSFFGTAFKAFSGHSMLLAREYEFAMKGVNAEVGWHLNRFAHVPFYFAAGPYYLNGRGRSAFGGQLRAAIDIYDILRLEGNGSYDHIFKWIGQGQIGLTFPLGRKEKQKRPVSTALCCSEKIRMAKRATQRVDRFEIIPIKDPIKQTPAINPATEQPYVFWFVNNTSTSSQGISQAPFNTLSAAQNASSQKEVIYVFPGDGTTNGMDAGIILQDGQYFLGAANPHSMTTTVGTVTIPAMASSLPRVTNTAFSVIGVSGDNTISGFYLIFPGANTCIDNFANPFPGNVLNVSNNVFVNITGPGTSAIRNFNNSIEILNSSNNIFMNLSNGSYGILNFSNGGNSSSIGILNSTNDIFMNLTNNSQGMGQVGANSSVGSLSFKNAMFNNLDSSKGVNITESVETIVLSEDTYANLTNSTGININTQVDNLCISNELFTALSSSSVGIAVTSGAPVSCISQSTFENLSNSQAISYTLNGANSVSLEITNNDFSGSIGLSDGYAAQVSVSDGNLCLEFTGNSASPSSSPTPYQFVQSATGIFNRTTGSDSSTNIGAFDTSSGIIGDSGTCNASEGACSVP